MSLILFFLLVFSLFTIVSIQYNKRISQENRRISELSWPSIKAINSMIIGMHQVSNAQRGHLLTHDERFREERRHIWGRQIFPAIDTLETLVYKGLEAERVLVIVRLLREYEKEQEELENYFIENSSPQEVTDDIFYNNDSRSDQELELYVEQYILDNIVPIREELIDNLYSFASDQEKSLLELSALLDNKADQNSIQVIVLLIIAFVASLFLSFSVVITIRNAVEKPTRQLSMLAKGELPEHVPESRNELNVIVQAGNKLTEIFKQASFFASEIGKGKFDTAFTAVSENDILGNALLQMREQLRKIAVEDQHRNWATQGLAMFADIIRKHDANDIQVLGDELVSKLIKYIDAHQGALFIIDEEIEGVADSEVQKLNLISYYAFDRKKIEERTIEIHSYYAEGLVGQAFLEKEKIFLSDLPEDYTMIASGLGDAKPRCLLIVPLKMNDRVEGVLELASLHLLEDYQIDFVERLGETIASTLVNVKSVNRTRQLLEESQQKGEQMRAQEEEMRQNMEELAATQEEMKRKSDELENLLKEAKKQEKLAKVQQNETLKLNKMMQDIMDSHDAAFYVKDQAGRYTLIDRNFLTMTNLKREEVIGRTDVDIFPQELALRFTKADAEVLKSNEVLHRWENFTFAETTAEYLVTRFPLFDQEGQKFAVCAIIMNESWLERFVR